MTMVGSVSRRAIVMTIPLSPVVTMGLAVVPPVLLLMILLVVPIGLATMRLVMLLCVMLVAVLPLLATMMRLML